MKKILTLFLLVFMGMVSLNAQWSELGGSNSLTGNGNINCSAVDGNGNIYVAGALSNSSGKCYVAKYNGSSWSELGGVNALAANSVINCIAVDSNGNVYVAGAFKNSSNKFYVAKYNGSSWSELGGANALGSNGIIYALAVSGNNIYAGGGAGFTNASGKRYVAQYNGSSWSELGGANSMGINNDIYAICTDGNGNVYAGGYFTDGTGHNYIVKYNGTSWTSIGGSFNAPSVGATNGTIATLSSDANGNIYTAGWFANSSDNRYVAKYNGSTWSELGGLNSLLASGGPSRYIASIFVDASNNVYTAGNFTNGSGNCYVAKFNGSSWSELGGTNALSANGRINSVCCDVNGNVYAVGNFVNGSSQNYVARYGAITPVTYTPPGNALNFDGVNDYVSASVPFIYINNFTMEAWINPSSFAGGNKGIFTYGYDNTLVSDGVNMTIDASGTLFYNHPSVAAYNTDYTLTTNKWYHIAITRSGGVSNTYVNGVLVFSTSATNPKTPTDFNIGSHTQNRFFSGKIDEFRFYSTALTQSQIQADAYTTSTAVPASLVLYYNFDNGVSCATNTGITTVTDLSNNSRNGTLYNFALTAGCTSNWVESYAMVIPTATAATSVTSTGFTANWTAPAIGTADNYLLDVSTSASFSSFVSGYNGLSVSGTSQTVTGLSASTTYYYRVRADKASVTGQGGYSNVTPVVTTIACSPTTSSTNLTICSSSLPYSWNGLTFNAAGTQIAHLNNVCGSDSAATLNLTVATPVTPSVSIIADTNNVCVGRTITFTATPLNGGASPSFVWKKNGVAIIGASNGSTYIAAPGTLANNDTVSCVLTTNNICQTTATVNSNKVVVIVKSAPNIGVSTGGIICTIGGTRQIYNSNTNGGGVWTTDNPSVATVTTAAGATGTATAIGAGTATMTYTKAGSNGCKSIAIAIVTVAPMATPAVISGATGVCKGATATVTNATPNGIWSCGNVSNATIDSLTGVVTGKYQGTATIKYTVTNAYGCSNAATSNLPVYGIPAVPSVGYAVGNTVNPQAFAIPATEYCNNKTFNLAGNPAGGTWSTTNSAVVTVTNAGIASTVGIGSGSVVYTVTVNGCSNSRSVVGTVVACPGHKEANSNEQLVSSNEFIMYPNPARTFIRLNLKTLMGTGSIVITDLYGKLVKTQALSMGNNTFDISNLSKGFYLVSIITEQAKTTKKLVVE